MQPPTVTEVEPTSLTTSTTMGAPALAATEPQSSTTVQLPATTTVEPTSLTTPTTMGAPALAATEPQSSTTVQLPATTTVEPTSSTVNVKHSTSFHDLQMIPHRSRPSNKRSRAKPPSFLLTSDEHFSFLESKTTSVSKSKKAAASKISVDNKQSEKCREAEQGKKRKVTAQKGKKMKSKLAQLSVSAVSKEVITDTDTTDNTPCCYCEIPYSQSSVDWYRCRVCEKWACGNCACVGCKSKKAFICADCK